MPHVDVDIHNAVLSLSTIFRPDPAKMRIRIVTASLTRRGFIGSMAAGAFSLGAFSSRSGAAGPDAVVPVPDIPNPDYLKPITDPTFGAKITRVTDPNRPVPGLHLTWGNVARHHYSIDPVWNADQSLLILDRGTKPRVFLSRPPWHSGQG